jgi:hypothetical protein
VSDISLSAQDEGKVVRKRLGTSLWMMKESQRNGAPLIDTWIATMEHDLP